MRLIASLIARARQLDSAHEEEGPGSRPSSAYSGAKGAVGARPAPWRRRVLIIVGERVGGIEALLHCLLLAARRLVDLTLLGEEVCQG